MPDDMPDRLPIVVLELAMLVPVHRPRVCGMPLCMCVPGPSMLDCLPTGCQMCVGGHVRTSAGCVLADGGATVLLRDAPASVCLLGMLATWVWGHHVFMAGLDTDATGFYAAATFGVGLPSIRKVLVQLCMPRRYGVSPIAHVRASCIQVPGCRPSVVGPMLHCLLPVAWLWVGGSAAAP